MKSMEDAWKWFDQTRNLLSLMQRLGNKHWDNLPWDGALGRDDRFKSLDGQDVERQAADSLRSFDDLAVLVLFSVFEMIVRENVRVTTEVALQSVDNPVLRSAGKKALDSIEKGPFLQILESYKALDANLVEEINQVRDYRNWVAHGKRGRPVANIEPKDTYTRLTRFLEVFIPPILADDSVQDVPPTVSDDSLSIP